MLLKHNIPLSLSASLLFSLTDMPVCTQYYVNSLFGRVPLSLSILWAIEAASLKQGTAAINRYQCAHTHMHTYTVYSQSLHNTHQ